MPGQHATLSPSSAARWISCPASIRLQQQLPKQDDEGSPFALEGTIAHALGELEAGLFFGLIGKVEYNRQMKTWREWFDAQNYAEGTLAEMKGHIRGYVDLLKERMKRRPMSKLMLEQRFPTGVPGCWGTSDTVIVSPTHVEIIDLKYGAGVPVFAHENPQTRLYALGALDNIADLLGDVDTVYMTIFQPRALDEPSTEELPAEELRAWRTDVAIPAAEETEREDARFGPSEKACRWCPASAICVARINNGVAKDFGEPWAEEPVIPVQAELMTPEQLGVVLGRISEIRAWCASVEAHALETAYTNGQDIPGWKVVLSGGRRGITDDAAAIQTLIDAGFKAEDVATFKAKPIGALEKLVGKKQLPDLLGDLLAKSRGKESLVPESDGRAAISPTSQAAADFKEVEA